MKNLPIFPRNISQEPEMFQSGYLAAIETYSELSLDEVSDLLQVRTAECKPLRSSHRNTPMQLLREGERSGLHDLYYSRIYMVKHLGMLRHDIKRLRQNRFRGVRYQIALWAYDQRTLCGGKK